LTTADKKSHLFGTKKEERVRTKPPKKTEKTKTNAEGHEHRVYNRSARPDEIAEGKKHEDSFVETHNSAVSYARVHERLWIGDMGAAIGVAIGSINRFTGVLNASGSELIDTVSIASIARRIGRSRAEHLTVWDPCGIALLDDKFYDVDEVTKARIMWKETERPTLPFTHGETVYFTHRANQTTRAAFHLLVMQAANKIKDLMRRTNGNVLVHCYAGRNRSAACIVAYLMSDVGQSFADALGAVERATQKRGMPVVLDNQLFRDALEKMPESMAEANEIFVEEQEAIARNVGKISANTDVGCHIDEPTIGCSLPGCSKRACYLCNRCGNVMYCSTQCQADHWGVHSNACRDRRE
jgi:hypothetical protein